MLLFGTYPRATRFIPQSLDHPSKTGIRNSTCALSQITGYYTRKVYSPNRAGASVDATRPSPPRESMRGITRRLMTNALLLTMMSAAPGGDAELNDWARSEHVSDRMRIAGFRTAVRFASPDLMAAPRCLALYDIYDLNVLKTSDYLAVSGVNLSPWSKRILAGVGAHWRFVGAQVGPEATRRATCAAGLATEVLVAAWRGVAPSSVAAFAAIVSGWFKNPYVLQARRFACPSP